MVTYNVHKARGLDGRVRPDRILRVLNEINPDVIALQEVVSRDGHRLDHHQARYFAEGLGYHFQIGENRRHRGGAYGNVLLSRFPIHAARNHDISVTGREPRGCLQTEIHLDSGAVVHIFNLHLGTALFERRAQAAELFRRQTFHGEEIPGNKIVLGDFNEWTRGLASRLFNTHFESVHRHLPLRRARTFPGVLPLLDLDYIYFDPNLRLEHVRIHRTASALIASDHLPLVAEFSVPHGGREMFHQEAHLPLPSVPLHEAGTLQV